MKNEADGRRVTYHIFVKIHCLPCVYIMAKKYIRVKKFTITGTNAKLQTGWFLCKYRNETEEIVLQLLARWRRSTLYNLKKWLRIYNDGSYRTELRGDGTGWYCDLFERFTAIGTDPTDFDGEMYAIHEADSTLQTYDILPFSTVFLIDSQADILALIWNTSIDCLHSVKGRSRMERLMKAG